MDKHMSTFKLWIDGQDIVVPEGNTRGVFISQIPLSVAKRFTMEIVDSEQKTFCNKNLILLQQKPDSIEKKIHVSPSQFRSVFAVGFSLVPATNEYTPD
jgi:hypothetical protein